MKKFLVLIVALVLLGVEWKATEVASMLSNYPNNFAFLGGIALMVLSVVAAFKTIGWALRKTLS